MPFAYMFEQATTKQRHIKVFCMNLFLECEVYTVALILRELCFRCFPVSCWYVAEVSNFITNPIKNCDPMMNFQMVIFTKS